MKAFLPILISVARAATLSIALVVTGPQFGAFASSITVNDPRPVAKAIEEFEKLSGRPITYEDPPYLYLGTTIDVSKIISRSDSSEGSRPRVLVPKGGFLTFTLSTNPSAEAEFGAVESMVNIYNAGASAAAIFSVWRDSQLTHVVPRMAVGSSGQLEPVTPVLDSLITLKAKSRTGFALLGEICQSVSAESGARVEIGMVPANALSNQKIAIGANYEPARDVLEKLIMANTAPLSWQLLYDPGLKTYYLNIPIVRQPAAKP